MKLPVLMLIALQSPSAQAPAPPTLAAGRARVQELSRQERHEEALALGAELRSAEAFTGAKEDERAAALYDLGVASLRAGALDPALEAWGSASALGAGRAVRLDALYNRGAGLLAAAEQLRLDIPELREAAGLPPAQNAPAPQDAAPADPLVIARAAYVRAREAWVERLRADPRDRATREGLELVQRRLRELEDLEKQREKEREEQQEQQDPEKPPQDDPSKDQKKDEPKDPSEEPEEPEKQDPSEEESEEEQDPGEEGEQPETPEDQPQEDSEAPDEQPQPSEETRTLSREEMQRLLDRLEEIEEQARQVQARIQSRRRAPVTRDW